MLACPRCQATYPDEATECPQDGSALVYVEAPAAIDQPLAPGTMVGEYRVDRRLGAGSFGEVYAGEQPLIGKRVAIKLLFRRLSADPMIVSRFVAEARAVNRIRHRNIIDIFSFGVLDNQRHYFVMELLDGLTLGELLGREKRIGLDRAIPIFQGIADALDAAHEAGVTHRDLKPDNIFLAREKDGGYFPKLLDFGVAKLVSEDAIHKTATGMAIGTPRYMAPEQCRGKKVDHHADIYALGVVIHEVLTGKPVFEADTAMDLLIQHTNDPPPPMSTVLPSLPAELDVPVLAMLAKRPAHRPASAGAAVAALIERARALDLAAISSAPVTESEARATGDVATDPTLPVTDSAERSGVSSTLIDDPSAPSAAAGNTQPGEPAREASSALGSAGASSPAVSAPPPRRMWPLVAIAAAVAAGVVVILQSTMRPPAASATSGAPAASAAPSAAPSAPITAISPEIVPIAVATVATATATASAASSARPPSTGARDKAPAKGKDPTDLERPPEYKQPR